MIDENANTIATFTKHRMLIFGEYLPSFLEFARKFSPDIGNMHPGPKPTSQKVLGGNLVVSTCLDGIHPWDLSLIHI